MIEQSDQQGMSTRKRLARIATSTLFGGLFYSIWLSVFLLSSPDRALIETILWLVAPLATAIGFTSGIMFFDHFFRNASLPFIRLISWPLVGCIFGALVVYWFGPMLIVFSMLAFGTISVAAREVFSAR